MRPNLLRQPSISIQLSTIYVLGLLLGIFSVWGSPFLLLIAFGGVIYFLIAWLYPEIALLSILVLTSTIFNFYELPSISIGVGHVIITDLLLFSLIGIILFRGVVGSTAYLVHTPLDLPFLGFYGTALLSTGIAIFINSSVSFNQSLGEVRDISFYLTFFVVTNLIRNEKQLHRFLRGIIFLGIFTALAMLIQFLVGSSFQFVFGRVEELVTAGATSHTVSRILPPGQSLILIVFVYLVVSFILNRKPERSVSNLIPLGITGLAVLLTFNRNFWVAAGLALFVVGLLISVRDKARYIQIAFWTVVIGVFVITPSLTKKDSPVTELVQGTMIRLLSLFDPNVASEGSLRYRYIENEYAVQKIYEHPLIGMGLGAEFRPWDRRLDRGYTYSQINLSYLHNAHLGIILKSGFIGYLFYMWFLIFFVRRVIQNWKFISDPVFKAMILSFGTTMIGLIVAALVNPVLRANFWTPVIGIMVGVSEVVIRMNQERIENSHILEDSV